MRLIRHGPWLMVNFPEPQQTLSWAVVGGGFTRVDTVAWLEVRNQELSLAVNPREFLLARLKNQGLENAVGLLTSRNLDAYTDVEKSYGAVSARCVATVGLSNALRAGDRPSLLSGVGTINILCRVSQTLSAEAMLETMALAVEARTSAVLSSGIPSSATGLPATGTGTDCVVIASPEGNPPVLYAGKHTAVGYAVGAAVFEAVKEGSERWKREWLDGRIGEEAGKKRTLCSEIK